jgi:anaerobic selenocysteine-containing dehydrogenase
MEMEEDKGLGKHGKSSAASAPGELERGVPPERDETLQHPRCVFQLLKKHYRRYTPEMIELICGVSKDLFCRCARRSARTRVARSLPPSLRGRLDPAHPRRSELEVQA